ncbi:unnamed protein product [Dicrocoelium dendriticum]|nr:unnamed protein product [Dicrocoelium dendriticum]
MSATEQSVRRSLTVVQSTSPVAAEIPAKIPSSPTRISWIAYYFSLCGQDLSRCSSGIAAEAGLVACPVCDQHFQNGVLIRHLILHLLTDELYSGSLWPFEFCPDCVCSLSGSGAVCLHREVHTHVRDNSPATLLNGHFVCPICEQIFHSILKFAVHLYERHVFRDAPYVCSICHTFHTSCYSDLLTHLNSSHAFTNQIFCPYCLKYFELPVHTPSVGSQSNTFTAHRFYEHVRSHWDDLTYRCESCRLDFVHRKDLRVHEYLHHCGSHATSVVNHSDSPEHILSSPEASNQLFLYYSNQLRTVTPRMSLKCLECGETLRQPISRHFNLTVRCPGCRFSSSCSMAVHWHWCNVHSAPSIPSSSVTDLSSELTSWERCVSSLVGSLNFDHKVRHHVALKSHDPCGSLLTRMRRCKHKHSPPGLEFHGLLRCPCGFRTILGNEMAKHLVATNCGFSSVRLDRSSRLPIFPIVDSSRRTLMQSRNRSLSKLRRSPLVLQGVSLCSNK